MVALLLILLTVALYMIFISRESQHRLKELDRRASRIAQLIAAYGAEAMSNNPDRRFWLDYQNFADGFLAGDEQNLKKLELAYVAVNDSHSTLKVFSLNPVHLPPPKKDFQHAEGESTDEFFTRYRKTMQSELVGQTIPDLENIVTAQSRRKNNILRRVILNLESEGEELGTVAVVFSTVKVHREIANNRNQLLVTMLVFLVIGLVFSFVLASRLTAPIHPLVSSMLKVRGGDLDQKVTVTTSDEIGFMTSTFNFMVDGLRERDRIKDTFQRYVTQQVADKILSGKEQVQLTGEKREATIMFSDIRGFTSMSESLKPEQVVSLLNEYLSLMIDVIFRYEGTLDKFIGDGIMAIFGAPIAHSNDPERAVRTALEMQTNMNKLNQRREARGERPIYIGIGINSGEVVAGNIGSSKRMEYTCIGDHVNLAARVESQTTAGQVLISENTYVKVQHLVEVRELPPTRVKGKEQLVTLYEVLNIKKKSGSGQYQRSS